MKIKTQDLTGAALDLAVARAWYGYDYKLLLPFFNPSVDWRQGGPIIEREGIRLHRSVTGQWWAGPESDPHRPVAGLTPLIAAMRCYVASELGDEVDIPEELL